MRVKKLITKRIALLVAIIQIELLAENDTNLIFMILFMVFTK